MRVDFDSDTMKTWTVILDKEERRRFMSIANGKGMLVSDLIHDAISNMMEKEKENENE